MTAAYTDHGKGGGRALALLLLIVPASLLASLALLAPRVAAGETPRAYWPWVPQLGISLSFRLDGLSLLFAGLVCAVGVLVFSYSATYMKGRSDQGRFALFLTLFMLSMLGLVLADNLVCLFVFWELTSITSFLLIGFDRERIAARRAAIQALFVTGLGGLALLAGALLLQKTVGTLELSELLAAPPALAERPEYPAILLLLCLAAFTKSAQFPFHFWLPGAMAAPTPVSAYLHSATMVKAGVYLLARLHPLLGGTDLWTLTLGLAGGATALAGSIQALRQRDLKLILAATTVSALGTIILLLAFDGLAAVAAVTFILVHALYKSGLFLMAGAVDHECGTRDIARLGGLRRALPFTAAAASGAALSMAGLPPFVGFIGKELMYEASLGAPLAATVLAIANAAAAAVAGGLALGVFFGPTVATPKPPGRDPIGLWLPPTLLALAGLAFGLHPRAAELLVAPAARAVLGPGAEIPHLALYHGFGAPLLLSGLTLAAGALLFLGLSRIRGGLARSRLVRVLETERAYDRLVRLLLALGRLLSSTIQTGVLRYYLRTVFLIFALAVGLALLSGETSFDLAMPSDLRFPEWFPILLILLAVPVPLITRSRLAGICSLGVVGVNVALLFMLFGAPDAALTQLLVETLTVIIVSLVLLRLPGLQAGEGDIVSGTHGRVLDCAISLAAGAVLGTATLAAALEPASAHIGDFYARQSFPGAHGRNIVNVILVDFRGFDTLGEITVLAAAGLSSFALLKQKRRGGPGRQGEDKS